MRPPAATAPTPAPRGGPAPAGDRRVARNADVVQTYASLAALLVLVVVFSALSPQFRTFGNLVSVVDAAAVLAVVTIGVSFVLLLGAIDLSVEGIVGACSLTVALLVANSRTGLELGLVGVVATIGLGAGFGGLSGLLSTRLRIPSFMTTLGINAVGLGVATILFAGVRPTLVDPWLRGWASSRFLGFTYAAYIALGAVLVGWLIQRYTRVGRYAYAIGGAEDIAGLSGVPVARYKAIAFAVAGGFYGLAAVMATAQLGSGVVNAAGGINFSAIAAAVIGGTLLVGGRGGVLHSMIGVLVLTVLQNGLILTGVSPYAQRAVEGVLVVAAVAAATWPVRHRLGVVK
ncbi:ABC transporter permease [Nitriliruptoraceae bacterium ZYF776]|nr:ABC transporter permease [Profundirhabdus halotolerans]